MKISNKFLLKIFFLLAVFFSTSCSVLILENEEIYYPKADTTTSVLIVADKGIYPSIQNSLQVYINDLENQGCNGLIYIWEQSSPEALKQALKNYYFEKKISGAFLIGNIPSVWYEMNAFSQREEFPCDLFYMDFNADWTDSNNNGIYDNHGVLYCNIYTSRLIGTETEINNYFKKNHKYRTQSLDSAGGAYIFKDDDWSAYSHGDNFGLNQIYNSIKICEEIPDSTSINYKRELSFSNAEYVYQWIHSYPILLCVKEDGNLINIDIHDIMNYNFRGVFYNLFNCSASRFTEENIAMSCLIKTDYALATHGSTKKGGNFYPVQFNSVLAQNGTWGDAFKFWYNTFGSNNDEWFLGMMICGDPALKVSGKGVEYRFVDMDTKGEPGQEEISKLENIYSAFYK